MNNRKEILSPSGTGYLIVNVFTARGAVPIENAIVVIKGIEKFGQNKILYSLRTDKKGVTEKISLAAPSASEALSCDYPAPYAAYDIEIHKGGYYCSENTCVSIFENVTTNHLGELISFR